MGFGAYWRLLRAGYVLAREGAFSLVETDNLPSGTRFGVKIIRLVERRSVRKSGRVERLTKVLNRLGPTYVKFGQILATRPDVVGVTIARDLSKLQDAMDPFDPALVPALLASALGERAKLLVDISPPIAAASIAQVHKAKLNHEDGASEIVAIKLLRPGIEARFRRDLESFFAAAKLLERLVPSIKRLRPVAVVETLERSARMELDLRFEAASISEFYENIKNDTGFDLPKVKWTHSAQRVLTTSWIDGIPVRNLKALDKAGIDRKKLAAHLMQSFLLHAIRDGLFHADMHPGNLFADPKTGGILAVDFGIMGRIGAREQRFLAEILYGFIVRDYKRISHLHFVIGYVPADQSEEDFALALRMIGEPMHGHKAKDISMANLLGQLFTVTELFNMQTRPELILLQKNMVLVEGVARMLDPDLDIWTVSEPIVSEWIKRQAGPRGKLAQAGEHFESFVETLGQVPQLVRRANDLLQMQQEELKRRRQKKVGFIPAVLVIIIILLVLLIWRLW